jgi:hypothetical protein
VCFDEAKKNVNQYREWKQMILHQFSLLHALSMQCLRLDDSLDNLVVFNRFEGYAGTTTASRDISLSERDAVRARYAVTQEELLSAVSEGLNRERKQVVCLLFASKMIVSPRQARDKHRESTQKKTCFLRRDQRVNAGRPRDLTCAGKKTPLFCAILY